MRLALAVLVAVAGTARAISYDDEYLLCMRTDTEDTVPPSQELIDAQVARGKSDIPPTQPAVAEDGPSHLAACRKHNTTAPYKERWPAAPLPAAHRRHS